MGAEVISFSISEKDKKWWSEFSDTIPNNKRSETLCRVIKKFHMDPDISQVEKEFNQYCLKNNLSKDAQLGLLMGPYRVWGGDPDVD